MSVSVEDQLRRLENARNTAFAKIGRNNAATKADGDEITYSMACSAYGKFKNDHGIGPITMLLKKKYRSR